MALDGTFLSLVKSELEILIEGRVDKIHQPSKEEILISIRTREGGFKLIFNTSAGTARVHITKAEIENPKTPPMFCMLMRKHIGSGKLKSIRQDGFERILYFDFEATNELGDLTDITLVMEIMGRHSNLIMINSQGKIIDSVKRVGQDMSSVRLVLPNLTYETPPREEKMGITQFDKETFIKSIQKHPKLLASKAMMKTLEGISPVFAREAEFYACRGDEIVVEEFTEDMLDRLCFFVKKTGDDIKTSENVFTILRNKEGILKDFCFCNITQYGNLMVTETAESGCELLDYFYSSKDLMARMKQRAQDLFKLIVSTSERIARRTSAQREELKECASRDKLKTYGDLVMANLYKIEKGQSTIEVENFYDENCPMVKISLDKRLAPAQNAQKYYNEYRKLDTAEKHLTTLIKSGEQELDYIDSVFDCLTRATTEGEIVDLRGELAEQGYVKPQRFKGKPPKSEPPLKFVSDDGYTILVGRNNKQNDKLTLKDSEKTDVWLHTKNIHGSHAIIKCDGTEPSEETITQAAQLAAYHSKARNSSNVPVDYTLVRYVKKPTGSKPGMVIFTNNKTLYVTPDEKLAERLKIKK